MTLETHTDTRTTAMDSTAPTTPDSSDAPVPDVRRSRREALERERDARALQQQGDGDGARPPAVGRLWF